MKIKPLLLCLLALVALGHAQPPIPPTDRELAYALAFDNAATIAALDSILSAGSDVTSAYFRGRQDAFAEAAATLRAP